ncbi:hypothetical protein FRC12_005471 [Ceratobasidium sp. 428]|nr:hypothetical protein FRC12_005471 [Ceratobasidium sp. 428]
MMKRLNESSPLFESTPSRTRKRSRTGSSSRSPPRSPTRARSHAGSEYRSRSDPGSTGSWSRFLPPRNSPIPPHAPVSCRKRSPSTSHSRSTAPSDNEGDPYLAPGDTDADARLFGELLGPDRDIAQPPPLRIRRGVDFSQGDENDGKDGGGASGEDGEFDGYRGDGGDGGEGGEDNEDDRAEPQIPVPLDDEGGLDDRSGPVVAGGEGPSLRDIYFRVRALCAFGQVAHGWGQAVLEPRRPTLRGAAQYGALPRRTCCPDRTHAAHSALDDSFFPPGTETLIMRRNEQQANTE